MTRVNFNLEEEEEEIFIEQKFKNTKKIVISEERLFDKTREITELSFGLEKELEFEQKLLDYKKKVLKDLDEKICNILKVLEDIEDE